jgi:hypothetical protein
MIFFDFNLRDLIIEKKEFKEWAKSDIILIALGIEHVFSYVISYFRSKDIELNGQIDINGVKRAKTELYLYNVQFFIACIIIGFTINHYLEEEHSSRFHHSDEVLKNYWVVIDVVIVFLS